MKFEILHSDLWKMMHFHLYMNISLRFEKSRSLTFVFHFCSPKDGYDTYPKALGTNSTKNNFFCHSTLSRYDTVSTFSSLTKQHSAFIIMRDLQNRNIDPQNQNMQFALFVARSWCLGPVTSLKQFWAFDPVLVWPQIGGILRLAI